MPKDTLYLKRPLVNADEFIAWAKSQGFNTTIPAEDLHVTIAYSKVPLEWPAGRDDTLVVESKADRIVQPLGDGGAVVLRFQNATLQARWEEVKELGAVWSFPEYKPHTTISWNAADVDLSAVQPYTGRLVFGPEIMRAVDENWQANMTEKVFKVANVDSSLGVVFGWGIVSTYKGEDYFDTQGDNIPDAAMLEATTEFMENSRVGKTMHVGEQTGVIVHSFPLTADIAKAFGITTETTGWMIGYKPYSKDLLEKFRSGELTGFSIGGRRIKHTEIA